MEMSALLKRADGMYTPQQRMRRILRLAFHHFRQLQILCISLEQGENFGITIGSK